MTWNGRKFQSGKEAAWTAVAPDATEEQLLQAGLDNDGVDEFALGFGHGIVDRLSKRGYEISAAKVLLQTDTLHYHKIARLVEETDLEWRCDPQVPKVVGLVDPTGIVVKALMVVYLDDFDHEETVELQDMIDRLE